MSHKRKVGDKRRLRKTYRQTQNSWLVGVYYDEDKDRLVRVYQGSMAKYFRRRTNKRLRKEETTLQHGKYRRIFDYWWELW